METKHARDTSYDFKSKLSGILFRFESTNNIIIKINHQELQEMDAFEK